MPNKPSYTLHLDSSPVKTYSNTYRRKNLEEMTTYQLRDICTKEKIIKGITDPLNRYELIETILRYRGEIRRFLWETIRSAHGTVMKIPRRIRAGRQFLRGD